MNAFLKLGGISSAPEKLFCAALACVLTLMWLPAYAQDPGIFAQRLTAAHRSPGNVARDGHRHPVETLAFLEAITWRSLRPTSSSGGFT
ncbi:MAG: hypothetical protein NT123_10470 [Proteobacteria bacterium]|nr:hypothetical protein [Pseudomonadota bacterium]